MSPLALLYLFFPSSPPLALEFENILFEMSFHNPPPTLQLINTLSLNPLSSEEEAKGIQLGQGHAHLL